MIGEEACTLCGGPTVLLLYSRVCREACERRSPSPPEGHPHGRVVASFRAEHITESNHGYTRWVIPQGCRHVTLVESHGANPADTHWLNVPGVDLPMAVSVAPKWEMPHLVHRGVKYSPVRVIGAGWDIVARDLDPSDPEYTP